MDALVENWVWARQLLQKCPMLDDDARLSLPTDLSFISILHWLSNCDNVAMLLLDMPGNWRVLELTTSLFDVWKKLCESAWKGTVEMASWIHQLLIGSVYFFGVVEGVRLLFCLPFYRWWNVRNHLLRRTLSDFCFHFQRIEAATFEAGIIHLYSSRLVIAQATRWTRKRLN